MKLRYSLFLLFLFTFISSKEETKEENQIAIIIDKAYGSLTGYEKDQNIILQMIPSVEIIPKNFTKLELKIGYKTYQIPTKCDKAQKYPLYTSVTCKLDLTNMFVGLYEITHFEYKNKTYSSSNVWIKIDENKNKKISDIKLIDFTSSSTIKEYSEPFLPYQLNFDDVIDANKFNNMVIESEENKLRFKIKLNNCEVNDAKSVKCSSKFLIRAGRYKIINIFYDHEFINPAKDLFIILVEDIVEIEKAYNGFCCWETCNDKFNTLNMVFNGFVQGIYFSKFFFKNVKTNKEYELKNTDFKTLYNPMSGSNGVEFIFDFHKLPPGKYYINYIYKNRMTYSNKILEIQTCKPIDDFQVYED